MNTRTNALPLAAGAALGALAMYFLDPDRGRRRRAELGEATEAFARRPLLENSFLGHELRDGRHNFDMGGVGHRQLRDSGLLPWVLGGALAALAWQQFGSSQRAADARIEVNRSIEIDAAPEEVFDLWSNYENFPHFMRNVEEVRALNDNRSHWIVKGPAGSRVEFDTTLVSRERPHLLAWRSEPGSQVQHEGRVRLEPSGRGGTRATVHMAYHPPGGAVGHAVASLFGRDPERELADDLQRMKTFIETGIPGSKAAQSPNAPTRSSL